MRESISRRGDAEPVEDLTLKRTPGPVGDPQGGGRTGVPHGLTESKLRGIDERTCVVAPAGLDGDGSSCGANFYPVVSRVAVVASGHVGQGVLVAGLFRDLGIEPFHGRASGGVVDVAAGVPPVIDKAGKTLPGIRKGHRRTPLTYPNPFPPFSFSKKKHSQAY